MDERMNYVDSVEWWKRHFLKSVLLCWFCRVLGTTSSGWIPCGWIIRRMESDAPCRWLTTSTIPATITAIMEDLHPILAPCLRRLTTLRHPNGTAPLLIELTSTRSIIDIELVNTHLLQAVDWISKESSGLMKDSNRWRQRCWPMFLFCSFLDLGTVRWSQLRKHGE